MHRITKIVGFVVSAVSSLVAVGCSKSQDGDVTSPTSVVVDENDAALNGCGDNPCENDAIMAIYGMPADVSDEDDAVLPEDGGGIMAIYGMPTDEDDTARIPVDEGGIMPLYGMPYDEM